MQLSWKTQRDDLAKLIKALSDKYGGDDREWLRDYIVEVIKIWKDDLNAAIDCFHAQLQTIVIKFDKRDLKNGLFKGLATAGREMAS